MNLLIRCFINQMQVIIQKNPFGGKGDFITLNYFKFIFEIISIWIITTWEELGKPQNFNFVELLGDGSLTKVLLKLLKNFLRLINQ